MKFLGRDWWDVMLLSCIFGHLAVCPFTKVEESFNMQAIHDFLYQPTVWDHIDFPGVVPRTSFGAIIIAALTLPFKLLLDRNQGDHLMIGFIARGILGALVWLAVSHFRRAFEQYLKQQPKMKPSLAELASKAFCIVTAIQFHFAFYASRTLPNTFALILVLYGLSSLLRHYTTISKDGIDKTPLKDMFIAVAWFVVACTVFRSDTAVLAVPLFLPPFLWLLRVKLFSIFSFFGGNILRKIAPFLHSSFLRDLLHALVPRILLTLKFLGVALLTLAVSLAVTVPVDSWFWRRWLWPEACVFTFNTVENKSHEWGVMVWHWYFTNALPRALSLAIPFAIFGMLSHTKVLLPVVGPAVVFVGLYSILPHKELRFVIAAIPMINTAAALGLAHLWTASKETKKDKKRRIPLATIITWFKRCVVLGLVCGTVVLTAGFTVASNLNYPGGHALEMLNQITPSSLDKYNVHIDVKSAQTGITRFGEHPKWRYSKAENVALQQFAYLISEKSHVDGFQQIRSVMGYGGLDRRQAAYNKLFVKTTAQIFIHQRLPQQPH